MRRKATLSAGSFRLGGRERGFRLRRAVFQQKPSNRAVRPRRQGNQSFGPAFQAGPVDLRGLARLGREMGLAHQP